MPARQKLKVYRTPIGFHDAYVAASSQKAALEAWGADANLFARGVAEVVTDPKLTEAALSQPGVVIRKARGTAAEHIDALPKTKAKAPASKSRKGVPAAEIAEPRTPRPRRDAMNRTAEALSEAEARHSDEARAFAEREKKLAQDRRKLEQAQRKESDRLQRSFDRAKAEYQTAARNWER